MQQLVNAPRRLYDSASTIVSAFGQEIVLRISPWRDGCLVAIGTDSILVKDLSQCIIGLAPKRHPTPRGRISSYSPYEGLIPHSYTSSVAAVLTYPCHVLDRFHKVPL